MPKTQDTSSSNGQELFASYLERVRPQIESYLAAEEPHAKKDGSEKDDLERYLFAPLARLTAAGGKRTRPALALLGCEVVGGDAASALPIAAAIETFQSAALIHDDIADEGELRRGMPCTYRTEGVGVATNIGDLGIVSTFIELLDKGEYSDATRLRLLRELAQMELHTVEGQALDLGWARDGRWDVSDADYLYMATRKTAYYSGAIPLVSGAICGGGTDEQIEALRAFGLKTGLAFQLRDDLLNLVGDPDAQGKDYRSDITEGKRTLVAVWAVGHLEGAEQKELIDLLSSGTSQTGDLARAVELMDNAGAINHSRQLAARLTDEAKAELGRTEFTSAAREVLCSMADFFVRRVG